MMTLGAIVLLVITVVAYVAGDRMMTHGTTAESAVIAMALAFISASAFGLFCVLVVAELANG